MENCLLFNIEVRMPFIYLVYSFIEITLFTYSVVVIIRFAVLTCTHKLGVLGNDVSVEFISIGTKKSKGSGNLYFGTPDVTKAPIAAY